MSEIQRFVGLDWARNQHRACVLDAEGTKMAQRDVNHDGAGLAELCAWLVEITGAQPAQIAVAIETPRGPIVEALLERGFAVYSINPKQLDRFRDRFTVAGAKDDSRDAHVLGDSLRTDRRAFRRLSVDDPLIIELREWVRIEDELKQERTRLSNRVRDQLWRYYPQANQLTDDAAADWFLDLWEQVPTPAAAARVSEKMVASLLKKRRIRRIDAAAALAILRQQPLRVATGTVEAATAHIRTTAVRLRLINQQIKQAEQRLDELCAAIEASAPGQICERRDVAILRSLPGLGRINIAALLAEACSLCTNEITRSCACCPGQPRSAAEAARPGSCCDGTPAITGCATQSITGQASQFSTMPQAINVTTHSGVAVTAMHALCAGSEIACSMFFARCSKEWSFAVEQSF